MNVITPVALKLLSIAYYTDVEAYIQSEGDYSAIRFLISNNLIQRTDPLDIDKYTYEITKRGESYIKHLLKTPLPCAVE